MTSLTQSTTPVGTADMSLPSILTRVLTSDGSATQALLRITLALVLFPHGAQHLLGWFGGYGFSATVEWMNGALGIPVAAAGAGILLEFFGPIALLVGVGSRLVGLSLAVFMAVAASTHLPNGFFMNWYGSLAAGAEGFEFHLLSIAMAVAIAIRGGGALSLDGLLSRRNGE